MRDQIDALGFCNASAIYSQTQGGQNLQAWERNRILCDSRWRRHLSVPSMSSTRAWMSRRNLIVFQRVTHSRRIFIQQLGRGLRLAEGKQKVIVLDFVSDIRRFAAGINLKNNLEDAEAPVPGHTMPIRLQHTVTFRRAGAEDPSSSNPFCASGLRMSPPSKTPGRM